MKKEIKINCVGSETISLDALHDFQGSLKKISPENVERLKKSIIKKGFIAPFFIWNHRGKYKIIDGHQRRLALEELSEEYDIPPLPVIMVEASSVKDAKEKLLMIASQFGDFDKNILDMWINQIDINMVSEFRFMDNEIDLNFGIEEVDIPDLSDGEKSPIEQMTFTVSARQVKLIKKAIEKVKQEGVDKDRYNKNENGCAITQIIKEWLKDG